MLELHQQFWNEWAEAYRGFSETIEPYREAQRDLARLALSALGEGVRRKPLAILDVGGGAGNLLGPLLETLVARRGNLKGVSYTLTDGAETMLALARKRLNALGKLYPEVQFQALRADMLERGFPEKVGQADLVISSWNVEYYPPESRPEIITRLVRLVQPQGVVAFSSLVRLPDGLGLRDVLMPLGQAQVFQGLLTGGPGKMNQAVAALREVARFGTAVTASHFPDKPNPVELRELAVRTGLHSVVSAYHLYGASVMVAGRKDAIALPEAPKPAIVQVLAGREGYQDYAEKVTFWSYLWRLLHKRES